MRTKKYSPGDIVGVYTILNEVSCKTTKYLCRCNKCGSEVEISGSNLKRSRMCRNCRTIFNSKPKIDLTGQRFGRLTALRYVIRDGKRNGWECICDCGNTVVVYTGHLRNGHTQSCGCYCIDRIIEANLDSLVGKRFSKLVVLERIENHITPSGNPLTKYRCECDCGQIIEVLAMNLVSGNTQSCGCIGNSRGEYYIAERLRLCNIKYKRQYSFADLVSDKDCRLKFDFGVLDANDNLLCLIEFHGEQHFYTDDRGRHYFGKQQREVTDTKKKEYCEKNGIKLYVIRYDEPIETRVDEIITDLRA